MCAKCETQARVERRVSWFSRAVGFVFVALVKVYQFTLSPLLGRQCRFSPTCSWYALEAIRTHGGIRGGWMAAKRLARCHPFAKGGYDPVPVE
jgi:uncharacterized protein